MTVMPADDRGPARAQVRAAQDDCLLLYRLLPGRVGWVGLAGWAFGLRVDGLRERIEAAQAALAAAEAAL